MTSTKNKAIKKKEKARWEELKSLKPNPPEPAVVQHKETKHAPRWTPPEFLKVGKRKAEHIPSFYNGGELSGRNAEMIMAREARRVAQKEKYAQIVPQAAAMTVHAQKVVE